MPRLTLRTLLAYMDDTLEPAETRSLGRKVAESEDARELVERIKKVTRRRGLSTPVPANAEDETADPNTVAEYLDNTLDSATLRAVEETCLESDVHLAEVAACHQILTLVLTEPVRVPPQAHRKMYRLVERPASDPNRTPNKALHVSGVQSPASEIDNADDADNALLLGLNRYSATTGWGARFALFGAALALLLFLAVGVFMVLQQQTPQAPQTSPGNSFAQLTPQTPELVVPKPKDKEPEPTPPKPKDKEPVVPKPKDKEPEPEVNAIVPLAVAMAGEIAATKPVDPGPGLGDPVPAPLPNVREIAKLETARVLVLTQPEAGGAWLRLKMKADDEEMALSNTPLMALPGYKANVLVGDRDKQVQVHLWGNVPEQLQYRVFESRVILHPPAEGFDADITLVAGRIYLKSKKLDAEKKPTGAKVRVRIAGEVWDITLPDAKADVLVELISWFEPGVAYARKEGAPPKLEARVAVVSGTAAFTAPRRFKTFAKVAEKTQITWDSGTGTLRDPKPIENEQDTTRVPTLEANLQKAIARVLTDFADKVTERNGTRAVIRDRLEPAPGSPDREYVARLAVYSQAALADNTAGGGEMLKPLVDELRSELPWLARQAVVTALTNWIARDRGNTAILRNVLINKGLGEDKDVEDAADRLLRLLRGFVSPTKPEPEQLDQLAKWLEDPAIPVREAALWNIVAVEFESWVPLPVAVNVGAVGAAVTSDEYKKFLAVWRAKVETLKKRPPAKKP